MEERNEVSLHEVVVYNALRQQAVVKWMTSKELAKITPGVAERTVRFKLKKFVDLGLCDQVEVFPAHRYRWSDKAQQRNKPYLLRLQRAAEVFEGVSLSG